MPFPNEHAARQTDPKKYTSFRRGSPKGFPSGVDVIYGIKDGKSEIQTVRFKSSKWTVNKAKVWLKKNKFKTAIEPASKKGKTMEKREAIVHKATVTLIGGESVYDYTTKINKAGQDYLYQNLNIPKKDSWVYMREAYADSAVFSVSKSTESGRENKLYGLTFKRDKGGKFEFSSPVEVEQFTQYRPVKTSVTVAKVMKKTLWG